MTDSALRICLMAMLWLVPCVTWATPMNQGALSLAVDKMAPLVERAAGRAFVEIPEVRFKDRHEIEAMRRTQVTRELMATGRSQADAAQEAESRTAGEMNGVLGFYITTQDIFLINEAIEGFLWEGLSASQEKQVIHCIIAHELAHALQHQHASRPPLETQEERLANRFMVEGHASLIQRRVCQSEYPAISDRLETETGLDILLSHNEADPPEQLIYYGYARLWAADLEARSGPEAIWEALSAPPPTLSELWTPLAAHRSLNWQTTPQLASILFDLTAGDKWLMWSGPSNLSTALQEIETQADYGRMDDGEPPRVVAGKLYKAFSGDKSAWLGAWLLKDPETALYWLQARAGEASVKATTLQSAIDGDVEAAYVIKRDGRRREVWVLKDDRLAMLATERAFVSRPYAENRLILALDSLNDLDGATYQKTQRMLLDRTLPPSSPAESPASWHYRYDVALSAWNTGRVEICQESLESLGELEDAYASEKVALLGHQCAVAGLNVAAAEHWLAVLGAPPEVRVSHADLLVRVGRFEEAEALLEGLAGEEELREWVANVTLVLKAERGEWDEALALVAEGTPSPLMRLSLVDFLLEEERTEDARVVLTGLCEQLAGNEQLYCMTLRRSLEE